MVKKLKQMQIIGRRGIIDSYSGQKDLSKIFSESLTQIQF